MPGTTLPKEVHAQLSAEHDRIRGVMAEIGALCRDIDIERAIELAGKLSRLAVLLASHNANEEAALRPLLRASGAFGPDRIEQMLRDHANEHLALRRMIEPLRTLDPEPLAVGSLALIESLRDHIEAEERAFMNRGVLHDLLVGH